MSASSPWWHEIELPEQEWTFRQIGPLRLWICRSSKEWRIAWLRTDRREDDPQEVTFGGEAKGRVPSTEPPEEANLQRVAGPTTPSLRLLPNLGDRSIVVHVETPFCIPSGREVGLFVSFPVWVRISEGGSKTELLNVPTTVLSSTWLGASTMDGELCFAAQLPPRLRTQNLTRAPHRAFGKVRVRNLGIDDFQPDRLVLPASSLNLYTDSGNQLWAQQVSVERKASGTDATVSLEDGPPPECDAPTLLVATPHSAPRNLLVRALGSLFG